MLSWLLSILLSFGLITGTTSTTEASNNKGKDRGTQVDDQPEGGEGIIVSDYTIK